jgi:hypothetical protein
MLEKIYSKNNEIVTRRILDETILVPIRGKLANMQRIFALNPVAEYIWKNINGQKSLNEILKEIEDNFEVSKEQALADLIEFVTDLIKENLLIEIRK